MLRRAYALAREADADYSELDPASKVTVYGTPSSQKRCIIFEQTG